jgi:hypothetical protein
MTRRVSTRLVTLGAVAVAIVASVGTATADPAEFDNGYGNAEAIVNSLKAQGYNVVLNGAAVNPLSGCRVTGVEGLRNSNSNPAGDRIDSSKFDTVYVDIACKGG